MEIRANEWVFWQHSQPHVHGDETDGLSPSEAASSLRVQRFAN